MAMSRKVAALLVLVFGVSGLANAADEIVVSPGVSTYMPGDEFSLSIMGMGFQETIGGAVGMTYDPTILELLSVTPNSTEFTFVTSVNDLFPEDGLVESINVSSNIFVGESSSGDFEVATASFRALSLGSSDIGLGLGTASTGWATPAGAAIDVMYIGGVVNVVPEMEVWAMMLAGMGLLGWKARRSQQRKEDDEALPA